MSYSTHEIGALQKSLAPEVYGPLDLEIVPERFRRELGEKSMLRKDPRYAALIADEEKVELFRRLTLMGDPLADAFAATVPRIGFPRARALVDEAAAEGIDSVPDAPPELVAWLREMEEVPDWVDWERIERAAKNTRLPIALIGEAVLRAAFMITYVNGYQGLPMVITGALTGESAAKRMKETISTFKLAAMPGALRRGGVAYQSAVKVRLMHAMVRTALLRRPETWDYRVYGVPIPQVDQMGAALLPSYRFSQLALARGGKLPKAAADSIELARYLASLLGMHDQFLSNDPAKIVETWDMVKATLRHKTDPRGKQLNDATVYTYRRKQRRLYDRALHGLDVRATRSMYTGLVGRRTAVAMGVDASRADALAFGAGGLALGGAFGALSLLKLSSRGDAWLDARAIAEIERQLAHDGPAEYRTDARGYAGLSSARRPEVRQSA